MLYRIITRTVFNGHFPKYNWGRGLLETTTQNTEKRPCKQQRTVTMSSKQVLISSN